MSWNSVLPSLQWGRVIEDADGCPLRRTAPHPVPSFNGAASSKTRMAAYRRRLRKNPIKLQWGRVIEDADGGTRPSLDPPLTGFNGAASSKTRMASTSEGSAAGSPASMGPRHRRRGWPLARTPACSCCSACFNGAASSKTRMATPATSDTADLSASFNGAASSKTRMGGLMSIVQRYEIVLQWGRVIEDADGARSRRRRGRVQRGFNGAASSKTRMAPLGGARDRGDKRASMGPRHRRRGWLGSFPRHPATIDWLQWGRVIEDADGADRRGHARGRLEGASMGPRHRRRGWPTAPEVPPVTIDRFNGAASSKTRMARLTLHIARAFPCFNGAASSKTRMAGATLRLASRSRSLQWGRVIEDADGAGPQRPRVRESVRFNGAASSKTRMELLLQLE